MTHLKVRALTQCSVDGTGEAVFLGLIDQHGSTIKLEASPEQAAALIMTLPGLLTAALQSRFGDNSLRHVFPLQRYRLERSSDGVTMMLSLMLSLWTADGFEVTFGIDPAIGKGLSRLLEDPIEVAGGSERYH